MPSKRCSSSHKSGWLCQDNASRTSNFAGLDAADLTREYYRRVDARDTSWIVNLFADDAVYDRAETTYRGRAAIARFFQVERQIHGSHKLDDLIVEARSRIVVATGRFNGVGKAGDARDVGFADVWRFNSDQRVIRRQTFLALGNQYVRD